MLNKYFVIFFTTLVLTLANTTHAYVFYKTSTCSPSPGAKWSTANTINVYFLIDSLTDYHTVNGITGQWSDYIDAVDDIEAIVEEYNTVDGSELTLQYAGPILGDNNLDDYGVDVFSNDSIVIGFTDLSAASNPAAPAWAPNNPNDSCTYSSRHIYFKKSTIWTFSEPDTSDVNGKYFGGGTSFRAVLLHEMGHSVGLAHETDEYAVMNHGTKAWTRGSGEVMQMELLPDDIQGINSLYNDGSLAQDLDISITNTWFMSAAERTDYNRENDIRNTGCDDIEGEITELEIERSQLLAVIPFLQGPGLAAALAQLANIEAQIATEEENLDDCYYTETTAAQIQQCKVSSRGDLYADKEDELVFCGVNATPVSNYPVVSNNVCPGDYVQLRFTINNKSLYEDADVDLQMWISQDDDLEVNGANQDYKSEDIREAAVSTSTSISNGRVFRIPDNVPLSNSPYRVFVRAVPFDVNNGASLWWDDVDRWNNSIRVRGNLDINPSCP